MRSHSLLLCVGCWCWWYLSSCLLFSLDPFFAGFYLSLCLKFCSHIMDSHGLCHWYSQPTPESYVIDTPADVGRRLDSYIVDTSADTSWAEDLRCIQRAIPCPMVWHSDRPVCMGVYCWTRTLCSVAFQRYNMHPCTFCKSSDMLHLIYSVPMLLDQPVGQFAEI